MSAYRTQDLYFDVTQIQHERPDLFGSGRLIGRNLILTARHVVTAKDAMEPTVDDWRVRLFGGKTNDGAKWEWRSAAVIWDGRAEVDLALLSVRHEENVADIQPKLTLRPAKIVRGRVRVEVIGFPLGARVDDHRQLMSATGILKDEARQSLTWGVDPHDIPKEPDKDWAGFSGAAVLLADTSDESIVWVYGVAQRVPVKFNRQIDVARLESAYSDPKFRKALTDAGVQEQLPESPGFDPSLLMPQSQTLLRRIAEDRSSKICEIYWDSQPNHLIVLINRKAFIDEIGARAIALWNAALKELKRVELVEPSREKEKTFKLTDKGWASSMLAAMQSDDTRA